MSDLDKCLQLIDNLIKYHTQKGGVLVVSVLKTLRKKVNGLR